MREVAQLAPHQTGVQAANLGDGILHRTEIVAPLQSAFVFAAMEVVACVVGVADVTARASSKIWKLCELWKDAPQDVYLLRDELGRASRFFDALKSGIEQSFPASLSPDMLVDFLSLLDQGHKTVSTLQLLFDDLLAPSNDSGKAHSTVLELSKTRKLYWLSRFHKTKRLRSSLRRTTEQIGLYMSLLTV